MMLFYILALLSAPAPLLSQILPNKVRGFPGFFSQR